MKGLRKGGVDLPVNMSSKHSRSNRSSSIDPEMTPRFFISRALNVVYEDIPEDNGLIPECCPLVGEDLRSNCKSHSPALHK